jgi:heavy metal translocating P-type ATPase
MSATPVELTPQERRDIGRRLVANLVGAALLGLGVLLARMSGPQAQVGALIQALAAVVVGLPVLVRGIRGLASPDPRGFTDQLVALAVLAAAASGDFVTATLVPLVLEIGRLFEERSALGARAAIAGLRKLRATRATLEDGTEVDPGALTKGQVVLVRPGEVLPADGVVQSGSSSVDQAPITGESMFEDVGPGSPVYAGTINLQGVLRVQVSGAGTDTVLGKVVRLLQDLEGSRVPVLRMLERYSGAYLPVVLTLAATVLFFTTELDRAIAVLVVATPTALVLAGPAAMVATLSHATRKQVLIKEAGFLERVAEVDTLLLDKTGTVTEGRQRLVGIYPHDGLSPTELLTRAASVASASLHPVSQAIVAAATERDLAVVVPDDAQERAGVGVVSGDFKLGRASWLRDQGLDVPERTAQGSWLAQGDRLLGFLEVADTVKADAAGILEQVRALGIERIILVTGDREAVARTIAAELGITEVVAQVLPQEKLDVVRREQAAGHVVMMVGDGVNDAPALAGADVGVAIGARVNEVALGGADVALLTPELDRLPFLLRQSARTRRVMTVNAVVGVGFSVAMLGLAAFGLISPLLGALLHNLGAVLVVANSARLVREPGESL